MTFKSEQMWSPQFTMTATLAVLSICFGAQRPPKAQTSFQLHKSEPESECRMFCKTFAEAHLTLFVLFLCHGDDDSEIHDIARVVSWESGCLQS